MKDSSHLHSEQHSSEQQSSVESPLQERQSARNKGRARGKDMRKYMRTSASAYEIGLSVVVGMLMGLFVDKWFDTAPWGFLWFSLAGILNVVRTVYGLILKMKVDSAREQEDALEQEAALGHASTDEAKNGNRS